MWPKIPLWASKALILRLARREIEARFRGSFLGLFWAVTVPLATLAIYSVTFGTIFKAKWVSPGAVDGSRFHYPMLLFIGLIVFGIISEPLNRSTGLILENISYVKKVVFPLEILPVVALLNAIFTAAISFVIFAVVYVFLYGAPPLTGLFLPIILAPLVLTTLGVVYFFSSLGVFLRDLRHIMPLLTTALLFLSSVLTPPDVVPAEFRRLFMLNPVTLTVNHVRDLLFWAKFPDPWEWIIYLLVSVMIFWMGAYWFMRTRKAFADVL